MKETEPRISDKDLRLLKKREVHGDKWPSNIAWPEASLFISLFLPKKIKNPGENDLLLTATRTIDAMQRVLSKNPFPEDKKLLEQGYKYLPKRWVIIDKSIGSWFMDRKALSDEIHYLRLCDTALRTQGRPRARDDF